ADMLAIWSEAASVPHDRILPAAERLVARHGSGPLVLNAMVADFFPLLRREGLVLPPDLLLIFKAMITMDGVLAHLQPGYDLSRAPPAARGELMEARLSRATRSEPLQAVPMELSKVAADAPHLLRSAWQGLDRQPPTPPAPLAPAIRTAGFS